MSAEKLKFIDELDEVTLFKIGIKIDQSKRLRKDIIDFFVKDGQPLVECSQEILDVVDLYIKGESPDYIGEIVFQTDGEPVRRTLKMFGIHT